MAFICLVAAFSLPAHAQQVGLIGPSISATQVEADRFDVVFDVRVMNVPAVNVLRNQPKEARFDAVVCNIDVANKGAVKADPSARWGFLDPGICTMFASLSQLDLSPAEGDKEWTAKVYLRAKR